LTSTRGVKPVTGEERKEMLEEYYQVGEFVQAYDGYFVSIKTWGVTASAGAIAIGISNGTPANVGIFLAVIATILPLGFWMTEVQFRLIQQAHIYRWSEVEEGLRVGRYAGSPRILGSFAAGRRQDRETGRQWKVAIWSHVMFPHIFFFLVGFALIFFRLWP
jgi:hypothetical protein